MAGVSSSALTASPPLSFLAPTPQRCGTHRTDIIAQKGGRVTLSPKSRGISLGCCQRILAGIPRDTQSERRVTSFLLLISFLFFFSLISTPSGAALGIPAVTQLNSIPSNLVSQLRGAGWISPGRPLSLPDIIALLS